MHHFCTQNEPFALNDNIFKTPLINLAPFIYVYLHLKNQVRYQSINEVLTV